MLIAAEVAVVAMVIYALGRGHVSFASDLRQAEFTAAPIAPMAAGPAPHVVVDDADSLVIVSVSRDELVHVRDLTQLRGAVFSNQPYPRLAVTRTADGVRIERPHVERLSVEIFGFSTQRIEIEVPSRSRVEIARCSGADVAGVRGGVAVHSVDGRITLTDLQGSIDAHSDDGRIVLQNVTAGSMLADTNDGRIEASGLSFSGDATLRTGDGSMWLRLAPNANVTIDASTSDGSISVDGSSFHGDDSAHRTVTVGTGTSRVKLTTGDGSIHIFTNGETHDNGL